jgi:hypothetical protein
LEYFSDKSLRLNILREEWPIPLRKFLRMCILGGTEKKYREIDPVNSAKPGTRKRCPNLDDRVSA